LTPRPKRPAAVHMGRPKKTDAEKTVATSVRLHSDIHAALKQIVKTERSNMNREINRYLAKALISEKKLTR
jgi:hypothetical protein